MKIEIPPEVSAELGANEAVFLRELAELVERHPFIRPSIIMGMLVVLQSNIARSVGYCPAAVSRNTIATIGAAYGFTDDEPIRCLCSKADKDPALH